jgi:hypothetical protein
MGITVNKLPQAKQGTKPRRELQKAITRHHLQKLRLVGAFSVLKFYNKGNAIRLLRIKMLEEEFLREWREELPLIYDAYPMLPSSAKKAESRKKKEAMKLNITEVKNG